MVPCALAWRRAAARVACGSPLPSFPGRFPWWAKPCPLLTGPTDIVRPSRDFRRRYPIPAYGKDGGPIRSEEHTSELQSLMRISYAVFCLKKKTQYYIYFYILLLLYLYYIFHLIY